MQDTFPLLQILLLRRVQGACVCVYAGTGLGASGLVLGVWCVCGRGPVCWRAVLGFYFLRFCVFGFQFLFFVLVSSYQFQIFRFEFFSFLDLFFCIWFLVFNFVFVFSLK